MQKHGYEGLVLEKSRVAEESSPGAGGLLGGFQTIQHLLNTLELGPDQAHLGKQLSPPLDHSFTLGGGSHQAASPLKLLESFLRDEQLSLRLLGDGAKGVGRLSALSMLKLRS